MEKKITRAEFAAALKASGAMLKPAVAKDPAKAVKKMPAKARELFQAQLGLPGGLKLTASLEGDHVVLSSAEGKEDRFALPLPQRATKVKGNGLFGKEKNGQAPAAAPAPGAAVGATPFTSPASPGTPATALPVPEAANGKRRFGFGKRKGQAKDKASAKGPEMASGATSGNATAVAGPPTLPPNAPPPTALMAPDGGPIWKPPLPPRQKELEFYPTHAPYAWVRIVYDEEMQETTYNVLEPPLTEREQRVLTFIEDTLVDVIEIPLTALAEKKADGVLLEYVNQIIYDYSILIEEPSKQKILYYVQRDFLGFGLIDAIMRDDLIEDISCDGPHVPIFLYHRKYESLRSNVQFGRHDALDGFVIRLAQRSGKHISIAEPLLDATLPDGSRLNATLSHEVTSGGSTFTVRKFRQTPFTPPDLVRFGTMSVDLLAYWWLAVQHGASAIYSGGTASGKTTSLNAILLFIPPAMKIVSIEDTRELNLPHPNWIAGVTRSGFGGRDANGRQAGEIDMFTLLKAALRQRPEYILVGEVRGQEAFNLFQAMATGHTAYGTMHADSVEAVIHRLESEPINVPRSLLEALDIVSVQIQTRIKGKRVRRTKELVEIVGLDPHTKEILTNTVFVWNQVTDQFEYSGVSYVLEGIQQERNWTSEQMRQEWENRKDIIRWLLHRDVRDFRKVAKTITAYYKDPQSVMRWVRSDLAKGPEALTEIVAGGAAVATPALGAPSQVPTPEQALQATAHAPRAEPVLPATPPAGLPAPASPPALPDVIEQAAAAAPGDVQAMQRAMEEFNASFQAEIERERAARAATAKGREGSRKQAASSEANEEPKK